MPNSARTKMPGGTVSSALAVVLTVGGAIVVMPPPSSVAAPAATRAFSAAQVPGAVAQPTLVALGTGGMYAVTQADNRIEIRTSGASAGQPPVVIPAGKEPVTALAFSADSTVLAVGSNDRKIRLYETATGKRFKELGLPREPKEKKISNIAALAFNAAGTELVASDSGYGWLIRYNGRSVRDLDYRNSVVTQASLFSLISDGGTAWIGGGDDGRLHFYDALLTSIGATPVGTKGPIRALAISPTRRAIAGRSDDGQVRIWNYGGLAMAAAGGALVQTASFEANGGAATDLAFRPDGNAVYSVDASGAAQDWPPVAVTTPPVVTTPPTNPPPVVTTPPDNPPPVVTTPPVTTPPVTTTPPTKPPTKPPTNTNSPTNKPPTNVATRPVPPPVVRPRLTVTQAKKLVGHSENVNAVAFSPDGKTLASGARDKTVRLWDVAAGSQKSILGKHNDFVGTVAFSPDGKRLATGGWDNKVRLWNLDGGTEVNDPRFNKHTNWVLSVAFAPNGARLASGSNDRTARVYGLTGGSTEAKVTALQSDAVASVAFSPDGTRLAGGGLDGRVTIWNAATLQPVRKLIPAGQETAIFGVVWLDNDTLVSAGKGGIVRVWNARTGKAIGSFSAGKADIYGLAYEPKRRLLASGGTDNVVRVWWASDVKSGKATIKPIAEATGHTATIRTLAFSRDGNMLASGGYDYDIVLWRVAESGSGGGVAE